MIHLFNDLYLAENEHKNGYDKDSPIGLSITKVLESNQRIGVIENFEHVSFEILYIKDRVNKLLKL